METYSTLEITESTNSGVFNLYINRPKVKNALSLQFFTDFPKALFSLDQDPNCHVIILSGKGSNFSSGIDISALTTITTKTTVTDRGRTGEQFLRQVKFLQDAVSAVEKCRKPVIAAVEGVCIGGGIDIISACDLRFCVTDVKFCVKEVDLAIVADLGTLQRLPKIVGFGNAMELALTGRVFGGVEAKEMGLVTKVFGTKEELEKGVRAVAEGIAAKSPLAVIGTKAVMLKSRDMSVNQGLDYVATWNSSMLLSDDLKEVMSAMRQKRKPSFSKL